MIADLPLWMLGLASLIVVLGVIVQTTTGMGFGLTSAPLLAMIDTHFVPIPIIVLGIVTASLAATKERGQVRMDEVGVALAGRFAGMLCAIAVLLVLPGKDSFAVLFSAGILFAVALSLAGFRLALTRGALVSMGFISGLMGTITSVGAPPMALIYQDVKADHARSTLNAFFAIGAAVSLFGLIAIGRVHWSDAVLIAVLAPVMLVASYFAPRLNARVARRYRPVVLALSAVAAINLLARAFLW
ncbi:sulfite exporter TauE/SafE family protein [Rhodobium gokarnense]|uniref:Probable membrane transporter protein n=1 Tax=Rhodobium gokarnense TaxID=364296 RepID=A0ABT3HHN1_9HYPH|nr:sulfite exporter TauE/SafE family protein [Rhodobium gokarnense]MCW2309915.1 putative membrane protein YfcA [Rhodobium gokarnense]